MQFPQPDLSNMPPQKHTISLEDAVGRTAIWRTVLAGLIDPSGSGGSAAPQATTPALPTALHIPFKDLFELDHDFRKAGIALSGARLYFTFQYNNINKDYHITGFLVPTVDTASAKAFESLPSGLDFDYIVTVPVASSSADSTGSSVYDFTLPCPTFCSGTNDLLTGVTPVVRPDLP
jgi:hypothetical protein